MLQAQSTELNSRTAEELGLSSSADPAAVQSGNTDQSHTAADLNSVTLEGAGTQQNSSGTVKKAAASLPGEGTKEDDNHSPR